MSRTLSFPDELNALLLKGQWANIILTNLSALIGVGALAAGLSGWLIRKTNWAERVLLIIAGLVLTYPGLQFDVIGIFRWV